jgi:hypothetical protein
MYLIDLIFSRNQQRYAHISVKLSRTAKSKMANAFEDQSPSISPSSSEGNLSVLTPSTSSSSLHSFLEGPQEISLDFEDTTPIYNVEAFAMAPSAPTTPVRVPKAAAKYSPTTQDPGLRSDINARLLRDGHIDT